MNDQESQEIHPARNSCHKVASTVSIDTTVPAETSEACTESERKAPPPASTLRTERSMSLSSWYPASSMVGCDPRSIERIPAAIGVGAHAMRASRLPSSPIDQTVKSPVVNRASRSVSVALGTRDRMIPRVDEAGRGGVVQQRGEGYHAS